MTCEDRKAQLLTVRPERVTLALEAPAVEREEIIERKEIIIDDPHEIPRSVREWDQMSGAIGGDRKSEHKTEHLSVHGSVAPSHKSRHTRSKSAHGARSDHVSERFSEHVSERKSSHHGRRSSRGTTIKHESRESSPVTIERRRSKSRHGKRSEIVIEGKTEEETVGESNHMLPGPLALVVPNAHRERRESRDIKDEIRELDIEKRRLKKERRERRHRDDSDDEVIIERVRSGSGERRGSVKVEKDRKGEFILFL